MCSNYRPATPDKLRFHFGVAPPDSDFKDEAYPGYMAPMIRRPRLDSIPGDRACALGMFGMVPHWADIKLARQTYNARTETVASRPSFRNAYKRGQFCVLPVSSFYEPSYESGKAVRWDALRVCKREGIVPGRGNEGYKVAGLPVTLEKRAMLTANGLDCLSQARLGCLRTDEPRARMGNCPVRRGPAKRRAKPNGVQAHPTPTRNRISATSQYPKEMTARTSSGV
jgi:hypothetical protein